MSTDSSATLFHVPRPPRASMPRDPRPSSVQTQHDVKTHGKRVTRGETCSLELKDEVSLDRARMSLEHTSKIYNNAFNSTLVCTFYLSTIKKNRTMKTAATLAMYCTC